MSPLDRPSAGIVLSEGPGEIRAVRLDHGLCIAFSALRLGELRLGAICRAVVRSHVPGVGSFLDLGEEAFLSGAGAEKLPLGARLLVQVSQSASGDKPIGVTRRLRWETPELTLTLDASGMGVAVARNLPDPERKRLKAFLDEQFPIARRRAGFTATARAMAMKSPPQALVDRLHALLAAADRLDIEGPPGPLAPLFFTLCASFDRGNGGKDLPILAPLTLAPLLAAENRRCAYAPPSIDPFAALDIDAELTEACGAEVPLPGGGWLTVEPTRAFVGIDIDSGRDRRPRHVFVSDALRSVARIIRLRNLSGTILVDPPRLGKAAFTQALAAFKAALATDPAPSDILGVTRGGLIEITRPRRAPPLSERLFAAEGQALAILRRLLYDPMPREPIVVSAAQLNWLETPRGRAAREQAAQKLGRAPFFRVEEL